MYQFWTNAVTNRPISHVCCRRITAGVGANLIGQHAQDRNQEATVYCGNLDPQVTGPEIERTESALLRELKPTPDALFSR